MQFFEQTCPTAKSPTGDIYNMVVPFFERQERLIRTVIGSTLFDSLSLTGETNKELASVVARFVCVSAFHEAIPHLDLVLTQTGFGVVSNDTIAPASMERVRNLREGLLLDAAAAFDDMIDILPSVPDWSDTGYARRMFSALFISAKDIADIVDKPRTLDTVAHHLPEIRAEEEAIASLLSPELMQHLRRGRRFNDLSDMELQLISRIKDHFVLRFRKSPEAKRNASNLLKFVEDNIDAFPSYAASRTYEANHFERYENKADDPCFIWG